MNNPKAKFTIEIGGKSGIIYLPAINVQSCKKTVDKTNIWLYNVKTVCKTDRKPQKDLK